jgi:hypothetical protein
MSQERNTEGNSELGAVNVPMTGEPDGQEPGLQNRIATGNLSGEDRHQQIAQAAYQRAELRGFAPGYELDDWLVAEREIDGKADER